MEGYANLSRTIEVPKLSAAPLPDVLFPFVDSVQYKKEGALLNIPSPAVSVSVGETISLGIETVHRSGVRLAGLIDVMFAKLNPDKDIATAALSNGTLKITGVSVGSVAIKVSRVVPDEGSGVTVFSDSAASTPALLGDLNVSITA